MLISQTRFEYEFEFLFEIINHPIQHHVYIVRLMIMAANGSVTVTKRSDSIDSKSLHSERAMVTPMP